MRILRAELHELPAQQTAPLSSAYGTWSERGGLLLRLFDEDGHVGHGEASPLPGYSLDTLEDCRTALANVAPLDVDGAGPRALKRASEAITSDAPAARFALEMAVLDLIGIRAGQPAWSLLSPEEEQPQPRETAMLIPGLPPEWPEAVSTQVGTGARTIKLKFGRAVPAELAALERVREKFPELQIRVDLNRSGTLKEAPRLLQRLAELHVEFVEEPVATSDLPQLEPSPVPIALDESLRDIDVTDAAQWEPLRNVGVQALVLKPMALGGLSRCLELSEWAKRARLQVMVSHLFDGPLALIAAGALALALPPTADHGLAPHAGLKAWPDAPLGMFRGGRIHAWRSPGLGLSAT